MFGKYLAWSLSSRRASDLTRALYGKYPFPWTWWWTVTTRLGASQISKTVRVAATVAPSSPLIMVTLERERRTGQHQLFAFVWRASIGLVFYIPILEDTFFHFKLADKRVTDGHVKWNSSDRHLAFEKYVSKRNSTNVKGIFFEVGDVVGISCIKFQLIKNQHIISRKSAEWFCRKAM